MRSWLALVVLPAFGCAPTFGNGATDGGGSNADGTDGGDMGPAPDAAPVCFGTFVRVCFDAADVPTAPRTLRGDLFTEDTSLCDANNDQKDKYCVVVGKGIIIPATVRVTGPRPLVLLSTTTVELSGGIDASSKGVPARTGGPGAESVTTALCPAGTAAQGNAGGYGGSFRGRGGDGEDKNGNHGIPAEALGTFPAALRAGCPGGDGGTAEPTAFVGLGGFGGGAIAIIATEILLDGTINVSGAGGTGGSGGKAGGGGGGSGGMIVIDAALMTGTGAVFANGGGGGQGGTGGGAPVAGAPGGESTAPAAAASGGEADTQGGAGGDGSSGAARLGGSNAGANSSGEGGGGAGGGGAGFIRAPNNMATIAPPPN